MVQLKASGTAKAQLILLVSPESLREMATRLETAALNAPISASVLLQVGEGIVLLSASSAGILERYKGIQSMALEKPDDRAGLDV